MRAQDTIPRPTGILTKTMHYFEVETTLVFGFHNNAVAVRIGRSLLDNIAGPGHDTAAYGHTHEDHALL